MTCAVCAPIAVNSHSPSHPPLPDLLHPLPDPSCVFSSPSPLPFFSASTAVVSTVSFPPCPRWCCARLLSQLERPKGRFRPDPILRVLARHEQPSSSCVGAFGAVGNTNDGLAASVFVYTRSSSSSSPSSAASTSPPWTTSARATISPTPSYAFILAASPPSAPVVRRAGARPRPRPVIFHVLVRLQATEDEWAPSVNRRLL